MNLVSMDGMIIKTLKSYLMRCRSCYSTTADITKKFCPKCGNDSLHRVAATVDEDGTVRLHIDWEKVNSTRGLGKMKKTIKGGKHDDCDQFFEDQRLPHNRPARVIDVSACVVRSLEVTTLYRISSTRALLQCTTCLRDQPFWVSVPIEAGPDVVDFFEIVETVVVCCVK